MYDPTEMVITGAFVMAAVVFVMAAITRVLQRRIFLQRREDEGLCRDAEVTNPPLENGSGKVSVGIYRAYDLFGVSILYLFFSWAVFNAMAAAKFAVAEMDPGKLAVNVMFQFVLAGLVVAVVARRSDLTDWLGLRYSNWPWLLLVAPAVVAMMWLFFGGLHAAGYMKWMESLGVETVQDAVKLFQEAEAPALLGVMTFAAVIAAPLCEEVIFRGYLYPVLKKYGGVSVAVFSSSLFFAAVHGNVAILLPLFVFGAVLVFLYEKTGSLWAPIAAHSCFNAATVIVQMIKRYSDIPLDSFQ
jgi:membrane protease YdiL (CAAX protease family)